MADTYRKAQVRGQASKKTASFIISLGWNWMPFVYRRLPSFFFRQFILLTKFVLCMTYEHAHAEESVVPVPVSSFHFLGETKWVRGKEWEKPLSVDTPLSAVCFLFMELWRVTHGPSTLLVWALLRPSSCDEPKGFSSHWGFSLRYSVTAMKRQLHWGHGSLKAKELTVPSGNLSQLLNQELHIFPPFPARFACRCTAGLCHCLWGRGIPREEGCMTPPFSMYGYPNGSWYIIIPRGSELWPEWRDLLAFHAVSLGVWERSMHGKRWTPCYFQPSRAGPTEITGTRLFVFHSLLSLLRRLDDLTAFCWEHCDSPFLFQAWIQKSFTFPHFLSLLSLWGWRHLPPPRYMSPLRQRPSSEAPERADSHRYAGSKN